MAEKHVTPHQPHVVVLGGGLAGMAAACSLVESPTPFRVTLVERRPFLGGRAFSFIDPETGFQVDNGQHVFLGCCTYYIDFLRKLGTYPMAHLQPTLQLKVLDGNGKVGRLGAAPLPAPFHLLPSFLRYPHLSLKERLLVIYGLTKILLANRQHPSLEGETFHHWLVRRHQSERAIENFWNLLILPTLNDDIRQVSASMGLMIFQEGVLKGRRSSAVGYSRVGLSALMGEAAEAFIRRHGGQMLMGKQAERLLVEGTKIQGVELRDGEVIQGDFYVSALPFDALNSIVPMEELTPEAAQLFKTISGLSTAPVVNMHLWYDRPVMEEEFVAFVDHPIQWVFNKSRILGGYHPSEETASSEQNREVGQYLCISLSGAWDYIQRPKEELRQMFIEAMANVFPKAKEAKVVRSLVVKQEHATFRCVPGTASMRPPTETSIENLFLAGEWTDTGWPSTMEGAVRSGVNAANAIISRTRG